jgi:hypothetical protein
MARDKHRIEDNHDRAVSDDGKRSYLYEVSGILRTSHCVEIAEHHSNGTSDAYEVGGVLDSIFDGDLLPVLPSFICRVCSAYAPPWSGLQTRPA